MQLACVEAVLRHWPGVLALTHVDDTICRFLGPPPALSLAEACRFGSLRLLDWIWSCSCSSVGGRTPWWSLNNHLCSDVRYYRWQFNRSLEVAVERGDLEMVRWILRRFSNCPLAADPVITAVEEGHLEVLKVLLGHDTQSRPGGGSNFLSFESDIIDAVGWRSLMLAIRGGHSELVQWLCENTPHEFDEYERQLIIRTALETGGCALAVLLLVDGETLAPYLNARPTTEEIERMLSGGELEDQEKAINAIEALALTGDFELLKQVAQLHSPPPVRDQRWSSRWRDAIVGACQHGHIYILKWMMEQHPTGQQEAEQVRQNDQSTQPNSFLDAAAQAGDIDMLDYLFDQGFTDHNGKVMANLIATAPLVSVNWLLEHCADTEQYFTDDLTDVAARSGRLDILVLFHSFNEKSQGRTRGMYALEWAAREGHLDVVKWLHTNRPDLRRVSAMDEAAERGHLDVIRWLHKNGSGCTTKAMDGAAERGHLDVLQWLHANRTEGCTHIAMDKAAQNNHLEVVKWLHTNTSAGCSHHAMNAAAALGCLPMVKWLAANRPNESSEQAMANAAINGRVGTVYWLHSRFSEYNLANDLNPRSVAASFEMLLFLRGHCPEIFTREFAEECPRTGEIGEWVQEICGQNDN